MPNAFVPRCPWHTPEICALTPPDLLRRISEIMADRQPPTHFAELYQLAVLTEAICNRPLALQLLEVALITANPDFVTLAGDWHYRRGSFRLCECIRAALPASSCVPLGVRVREEDFEDLQCFTPKNSLSAPTPTRSPRSPTLLAFPKGVRPRRIHRSPESRGAGPLGSGKAVSSAATETCTARPSAVSSAAPPVISISWPDEGPAPGCGSPGPLDAKDVCLQAADPSNEDVLGSSHSIPSEADALGSSLSSLPSGFDLWRSSSGSLRPDADLGSPIRSLGSDAEGALVYSEPRGPVAAGLPVDAHATGCAAPADTRPLSLSISALSNKPQAASAWEGPVRTSMGCDEAQCRAALSPFRLRVTIPSEDDLSALSVGRASDSMLSTPHSGGCTTPSSGASTPRSDVALLPKRAGTASRASESEGPLRRLVDRALPKPAPPSPSADKPRPWAIDVYASHLESPARNPLVPPTPDPLTPPNAPRGAVHRTHAPRAWPTPRELPWVRAGDSPTPPDAPRGAAAAHRARAADVATPAPHDPLRGDGAGDWDGQDACWHTCRDPPCAGEGGTADSEGPRGSCFHAAPAGPVQRALEQHRPVALDHLRPEATPLLSPDAASTPSTGCRTPDLATLRRYSGSACPKALRTMSHTATAVLIDVAAVKLLLELEWSADVWLEEAPESHSWDAGLAALRCA